MCGMQVPQREPVEVAEDIEKALFSGKTKGGRTNGGLPCAPFPVPFLVTPPD